LNEDFSNEIIFIGGSNKETIDKLSNLPFPCKIFDETDVKAVIEYANKFDGIVFYNLDEIKVQILLHIKPAVKTFLRFFGYELYGIGAEYFLSAKTWNFFVKPQRTFLGKLRAIYLFCKRKLKIMFNKEYDVQPDNQRKVYAKLDAVMMINRFEYLELSKRFYLPRLIELQFTNHENEIHQFKYNQDKSNKIIIGNSGHRWNNHIDVLDIIGNAKNESNTQFCLFFSYGTESIYSQEVRSLSNKVRNLSLIEEFLDKEKFEEIYSSAAALVINSYRQHAIGNIITGIKYGCKIYLNKKSSTYHWLISKGFLISEVGELRNDIESGNIKLTVEQQQHNFDSYLSVIKSYSVNDFLNNVRNVLENQQSS
jgi:hypothetical protein